MNYTVDRSPSPPSKSAVAASGTFRWAALFFVVLGFIAGILVPNRQAPKKFYLAPGKLLRGTDDY